MPARVVGPLAVKRAIKKVGTKPAKGIARLKKVKTVLRATYGSPIAFSSKAVDELINYVGCDVRGELPPQPV